MAVIFLSFINFIYSVPLISNLIALCFAVLYSAYILIDTQIILGRGKTKLNLDNYVLGAILLYIDIIGLFLEILKLIGNRRSD
jgi:FtsH-binding integral membrane protein